MNNKKKNISAAKQVAFIIAIAVNVGVDKLLDMYGLYDNPFILGSVTLFSMVAILITLQIKQLAGVFKVFIYTLFGLLLFWSSLSVILKQPLAQLASSTPVLTVLIAIILIGLVFFFPRNESCNTNFYRVFNRKMKAMLFAPLLFIILFLSVLAYLDISLVAWGAYFILLMLLIVIIQITFLIGVIVNSLDEMWQNILNKSIAFAGIATGLTSLVLTLAYHLKLFVSQPEWGFYLLCTYFLGSFIYFKVKS